eukprot:3184791-Rhodomonas_salina.3
MGFDLPDCPRVRYHPTNFLRDSRPSLDFTTRGDAHCRTLVPNATDLRARYAKPVRLSWYPSRSSQYCASYLLPSMARTTMIACTYTFPQRPFQARSGTDLAFEAIEIAVPT